MAARSGYGHNALLRKNAHQALEQDQTALRLLLKEQEPDPAQLAYARMQVNQAHNALVGDAGTGV